MALRPLVTGKRACLRISSFSVSFCLASAIPSVLFPTVGLAILIPAARIRRLRRLLLLRLLLMAVLLLAVLTVMSISTRLAAMMVILTFTLVLVASMEMDAEATVAAT